MTPNKYMEIFSFDQFTVGFGYKETLPEHIQETFPTKQLCLLKQTHSDILWPASPDKVYEGDAHWTQNPSHLLLIKSADCLPVMIASPKNDVILGIHAGWRGVALQITEKALQHLSLLDDPEIRIWIGPHIQQKSFQVDHDVALQILKPFELSLDQALAEKTVLKENEKYLVNLSKLLKQSLQKMDVNVQHLYVSPIDTHASAQHYSYRRKEVGVRNYSFITKEK